MGEVAGLNEGEDLLGAVAEGVAAVAVADYGVVFGDGGLGADDCGAAGLDALADVGVVEG